MPPLLQTYYNSKENLISSAADKVTTTRGPHKKKWELGETGMSNGQLRTPSFKAHLTAELILLVNTANQEKANQQIMEYN